MFHTNTCIERERASARQKKKEEEELSAPLLSFLHRETRNTFAKKRG